METINLYKELEDPLILSEGTLEQFPESTKR